MISIFVMYSPDRKEQFDQMVECMRDMALYEHCQKIVLVDGHSNLNNQDWEVVEVPRELEVFSWAKMWEAGVQHSKYDVILYLDSDRVLPLNYLQLVLDRIEDDQFLFSQELFTFLRPVETAIVKTYRDTLTPAELKRNYGQYKGSLWYDPRFRLPCDGPGKGVMSGNTAFTKTTYLKSGGVDPWFRGHGAYADTDLHKRCWGMGMEMVDLGVLELHLHHEKLTDVGDHLSRRDLEVLSLNNYIYYCRKWDLNLDRARYIAGCLKLSSDFVKRVRNQLDAVSPGSEGLYQPLLG